MESLLEIDGVVVVEITLLKEENYYIYYERGKEIKGHQRTA